MTNIAVLDDWQEIALKSADWEALKARGRVEFFHEAFALEDDAAARLRDFEVVMAMRERTAFPASLVRRLPNLRLFSLTGARAASVDMAALRAQGVTITYTEGGGTGTATAELALALMLAALRNIPHADATIRRGGFQAGVAPGEEAEGKVLGLIGLGRLGRMMARYCAALGMEILAWSQNLTAEAASQHGAAYVPKEALLERSDVVSLHLVPCEGARGILGAGDLARMKPGRRAARGISSADRSWIGRRWSRPCGARRVRAGVEIPTIRGRSGPAMPCAACEHGSLAASSATQRPQQGADWGQAWRTCWPSSNSTCHAHAGRSPESERTCSARRWRTRWRRWCGRAGRSQRTRGAAGRQPAQRCRRRRGAGCDGGGARPGERVGGMEGGGDSEDERDARRR